MNFFEKLKGFIGSSQAQAEGQAQTQTGGRSRRRKHKSRKSRRGTKKHTRRHRK